MAQTVDPAVASEADFQAATVSGIRLRLEASAAGPLRYAILEPFALDVGVLVAPSPGTPLRLIEFKAFAGHRAGGIGFGDRNG
ncbi:MAG: hypothetical protein HYY95_25310 [Candidatus Rokubacteria bacterium]|nr:hypothetical protein [Candidatus Rokubacteria bacterium]MBI3108850.1 hypothetical protein [Candidatus Rokubacteria bacterium]